MKTSFSGGPIEARPFVAQPSASLGKAQLALSVLWAWGP